MPPFVEAAVDAADKEGDQALHALCANVAGPAAGELPRGMEVPDYLACAKVLVDAGAPLEAKGAGKKPLALAALRAASATSWRSSRTRRGTRSIPRRRPPSPLSSSGACSPPRRSGSR